MEYILLLLLIISIVLEIIIIFKKTEENDLIERLGKLEKNISNDLADFKFDINKNLMEDFNKLNNHIEDKLLQINEKVNERIDENFEKTNKTFNNILERLTKIDEAQKKIDSLSTDIVSLQSVLTDKKTRGIFGEVNLNYILTSVFGENNKNVYELQHPMSNGTIADSILYAPSPLGTIVIDSKFPLENYEKMTDKTLPKSEQEIATKLFKSDVRKHIDAISKKYIIPGETAEEAIMFLPAEAIFAEINAYHPDLLKYSYEKKVWITSPTTLMSTLTIIEMILKNMERDRYAQIIHVELNKLSKEFTRYRDRWNKLSNSIKTVNKEIEEINITTDKITKRFDSINSVDIGTITYEKLPEPIEDKNS